MNTYYGTYQQLHTNVKQACDCLASYNSSKFQSEISNIKSDVDNVSIITWQDSAGELFRENKEVCSKELNNIISNISSVFKLMESTYIALNSQLENLKKAGYEYDDIYSLKPLQENYQQEEVYEVLDDGTSKFVGYGYGTYDNDLLIWESNIETINKQCNNCVANIEAYLNILKQIDNSGMDASVLGKFQNMQIPEVYQFITTNIDKNNTSSSTTNTKGVVLESLGFLSGQELLDFKNNYNISLDDKISVESYRATVSGVSFDSYMIFDADDKKFDENFKKRVNESLKNLSNVDTAILQKVRDSDYKLLYAETFRCESYYNELGWYPAAATYSWENKHITTFINENWTYDDYYEKTIYHEFGHAYDHTVASDYINKADILTCLDENGSRKSFRNLSELPNSVLDESTNIFDWYNTNVNCDSSVIADTFLKKPDGGVYSWADLIDLEAKSFVPDASIEGLHKSQTEFFASIFGEYYSNPERLKTVAPKCYEAMDKLINIDKSKYMM